MRKGREAEECLKHPYIKRKSDGAPILLHFQLQRPIVSHELQGREGQMFLSQKKNIEKCLIQQLVFRCQSNLPKVEFYCLWPLLGSILMSDAKRGKIKTNKSVVEKLALNTELEPQTQDSCPELFRKSGILTAEFGKKKISGWQSKQIRMDGWKKQTGLICSPNPFGSNVYLCICMPVSACKNTGIPFHLEDHYQFPKSI